MGGSKKVRRLGVPIIGDMAKATSRGVNDNVGVAVMNPYIIIIIEWRIPKNGQNSNSLVVTVHKNFIFRIFIHIALALQFINRYRYCIVTPAYLRQVVFQKTSIHSLAPNLGLIHFWAVLGIRDNLVRIRIRIPGSVGTYDKWIRLLSSLILRMERKNIFSHFFLITCLQAHHLQSIKFNFLLKFFAKI